MFYDTLDDSIAFAINFFDALGLAQQNYFFIYGVVDSDVFFKPATTTESLASSDIFSLK